MMRLVIGWRRTFVLIVLALGLAFAMQTSMAFGAPNPSADLDQYGNDAPAGWQNGNLNATQATYFEGDSVPYRMKLDNLSTSGSHTITFEWDTTKGGKHALDYLTSFDKTIAGATSNPCAGVSGCSLAVFTNSAIPADPNVTGAGVTPIAGNFTLYGGTISGVSAYTLNGSYAGDSSTRITVTFTAAVANPVLAWGGHIATRTDWGLDNAAVNIPGSPYHTRLIALDGAGGNQDRSLSADAVIFPGSITIVKAATPEGSTSFPFTASPLPLSNFNLVDDGTSANTHEFSNITDFKTYSVSESAPAGWALDSINCSVTSANGGSQTVSLPGVSINLKEGENVSCTFANHLLTGTLTVIKHVVNDNGGTATASDFTLHVKSGTTDVTGSPAAGSESGTGYTLNAGAYVVSENTPPTNYTRTGFSGDCDASGNITVVAGQSKTCTITNDDNAPQLHLRKTVTNNNGGNAVETDWTLTATGTGGSPTNLSGSTPVDSGATFKADTYALGETGPTGYTGGAWGCGSATMPDATHVTVPLGGDVTCTINNDDNAAHLIIIKHVVNDNGGIKVAGDFSTTISGVTTAIPTAAGVESPGVDNLLTTVGSYSIDEGAHLGYAKTLSADCTGTIALGQTKTCTITNDDVSPQLIVIKHVVNDNGGNAVAGDFTMNVTATNPSDDSFSGVESPGVNVTLNAGSYSVDEGTHTGYTKSLSADCSGSVALGETKTCTITNDDISPTLTLVKTVTNNSGGGKVASDFQGKIDGSNVAWSVVTPVDAGAHTASEVTDPGYQASVWGTDCAANGTVTLALDEDKTCTITNDDKPATLIVKKIVINDNGGTKVASDFSFSVNDGSGIAFEADGQNDLTVNAGTYDVGEDSVAGYSTTYDNCLDLVIPNGGTATCTITNNDIAPQLIVIKHVVNDNGGTAVASDFTMAVTATNPSDNSFPGAEAPGTTITLDAGAYNVTEGGPSGYSASFSADCTGTAVIGGTKTCTVTNDDIAPQLTVIKHVVNDNGGNAVAGDFTMNVTATNPSDDSFPGVESSGTTISLNAGSYSVDESTFTGYTKSLGANCSGTIAVGETKTCTITNDDIAPTITLIKVVINDNGGTAGVNDFGLTIGGVATNSGDVKTVSANTPIALNEAGLTGYQFVSITGDLKCPTVLGGTATLGEGEGLTCTITNNDIPPPVTRTLGFWQTHFDFTSGLFNNTKNDQLWIICNGQPIIRDISNTAELFGGFYANIAKTTTNVKRSALDQARMQLMQQLLAAILNHLQFGSGTDAMFAAAKAAYCGTDRNAILAQVTILDNFNNSGDSQPAGVGTGKADPKASKDAANLGLWNVLP